MDTFASCLSENKASDNQAKLTNKPISIKESGIPSKVIESLLLKHLMQSTDEDTITLSHKLGLTGNIVDPVLQKLKSEALIEIFSDGKYSRSLRYSLTVRGRQIAQHELQRDGYIGPAPISLTHYQSLVLNQSSSKERVTPELLRSGLNQLVLPENIIFKVGPALNSGRAIFIYGLPGTGKTYVSRRLVSLFNNDIFIPYSVCVGNQIIQVYDPILHKAVHTSTAATMRLDEGHDERLIRCKRPEVVVGGELTAEMLEITFDATHRINRAPLQMKANNGILLIDDLGRQKVAVDAILNRWIIPLEERIDYLATASGEHFDIPFEQILVFSSNIHPAKLADDAFLRRIGYKIEFGPISREDYCQLWQQHCQQFGLSTSTETLNFVINTLHQRQHIPLLPCYPRDLVSMCHNQIQFTEQSPVIDQSLIELVWHCYFVDDQSTGVNHDER
ncbi:AAA family ATPase [Photobacterium ganghwense]|uniref:ATPase AAA n=1 Tax=Photobacterium ganghwense TaxID=320778 RepID=A0A0J1HES8_9GAMM|nr:ATPase AAA [Photobacterium ganghwense]KLV10144.1 ATPase AAA [Photobacterium ganghwense]PSU05391.1 AAA family ATPase [Photobacterium ganghwense]QSV17234.1 AAA family ATPase [Photobacterium ganghwense]